MGDPDEFLVARGASMHWTVVQCSRTLLSLAQRGKMGVHPANFTGASGSHFLLGLNLLTVTVVLEPQDDRTDLAVKDIQEASARVQAQIRALFPQEPPDAAA